MIINIIQNLLTKLEEFLNYLNLNCVLSSITIILYKYFKVCLVNLNFFDKLLKLSQSISVF